MAKPLASLEGLVGARDEPEPRLMISKIVCENFKSYAGVKELGPFHKVTSRLLACGKARNHWGWVGMVVKKIVCRVDEPDI